MPQKPRTLRSVFGQFALAVTALSAMIVTSQNMKPVYAGQAPLVQRLVEASPLDSAAERAPWAVAGGSDAALQTEQFAVDRQAFARDLVSTGRVRPARADSLAMFAVREAYRRRVPPALVFGVLLTENSSFKSHARSSVGAVGLMQVYGKVWIPTLGKLFGRDLRNDETNLRYGVHILSHYVYRAAARSDSGEPDGVVRTGLLRYNGCVRGANTAGCHRYPDKVRLAVERYATAQCGAVGFAGCVEEPLRLSLAAGDGRPTLASR